MSDQNTRRVEGFPLIYGQGTLEVVVYIFHFDKLLEGKDGVVSAPTCKLFRLSDGADVTSTHLSGASSYDSGTFEFTAPPFSGIERDVLYRLVPGVTVGNQFLSCYKDIRGEL